MEKELEQMLQTVCSKGIKEASSEEIYAALLQWSKEKMNGMKHNEGDKKHTLLKKWALTQNKSWLLQ